ncbi:MAG TPA: D-alanyl-D-alanine carboxypeptidase, partial [Blastocatellia bacterium]|nr:D-alanyl-D-alanine carboxypeptidase [Blastocatellia bacterium]
QIVKRVAILPILILLLPVSVQDRSRIAARLVARPASSSEELRPLESVASYKETLSNRGHSLDDQGILIETLDSANNIAELNADVTFNPASVMKLATSLVALMRLGPDYRYRTDFLADGPIEAATGRLVGDLVVAGAADPMFSLHDAQEVAVALSKAGVTRVTGSLRIAGDFYYFATGYRSNLSRETSAEKLRGVLEQSGIRIEGQTVFGENTGRVLVSHHSDQLSHLLLYQNAHSSNAIAEVIGESVGGPRAVQEYLTQRLRLRDSEIYVGRTSGLEFNRITPRASLKVLRALLVVLESYSLKPEDVMPVAGIDTGTLRDRLYREGIRGSVVAKTGTLVSLEKGVSTLVGVAYTKARGPLLFAIFNSAGDVNTYRQLQDQFLERLLDEGGGAVPVSRTEDALAEADRRSIVQVFREKQKTASHNSAD